MYPHINSSLMSLSPYFFTYTRYVWRYNVTVMSFCHVLQEVCRHWLQQVCSFACLYAICMHRNAATRCNSSIAAFHFILFYTCRQPYSHLFWTHGYYWL